MAIGTLIAIGIDPEDIGLFGGPTYLRHRSAASDALRAAVEHLTRLADQFDASPNADQALDAAMPRLGELLHDADMAIGRFRATRDCKGSA